MAIVCSMAIEDVFKLSDGSTVFVGNVMGWDSDMRIPECEGTLLLEEAEVGNCKLCGQMMLNPATPGQPVSMQTFDEVALTKEAVRKHRYILRMTVRD